MGVSLIILITLLCGSLYSDVQSSRFLEFQQSISRNEFFASEHHQVKHSRVHNIAEAKEGDETPSNEVEVPTEIHSANEDSDSNDYSSVGSRFMKLTSRPDLGWRFTEGLDTINIHHKYVVIAVNRPEAEKKVEYLAPLPLTCMTWQQIGFGCFLISVQHTNYTDEKIEAVNILYEETLKAWNKVNVHEKAVGTNYVHMELKVSDENRVIQMAQCIRLFLGKILKHSLTEAQFKAANGLYLLTSDSDFLPLSTPIYHSYHHDWNLVNVINNQRSKFYVAMSCIGSYLNNWNELIDLKEYETETYSSDNIIEILRVEQERLVSSRGKINWFLDQVLISEMLKKYGEAYTFGKSIYVRNAGHTSNSRLDRNHIKKEEWDMANDEKYSKLFKDAHFCREIWLNDCWWKMYAALKPIFEREDFDRVLEYKANLLKIMVLNVKIGDQHEHSALRIQQSTRANILRTYKIDICETWSSLYPRIYTDYVPTHILWEEERVFKEVDTSNKTIYRIIPKNDYLNGTLPFYLRKSKEVFLQKR